MYDAVLFPTDGSPGSERARDYALQLAADQDATLHVLHVVETVSPGASLHDLISEQMTERGTELVESVARLGRDRNLSVRTAVVEGDPAETITGYASSEEVDVIVMPTHGRSELGRLVLGSVTDRVIRTSETPVIVVKLDD
jgi:nucleotide-binding universal stress UspA family protein